MTKQMENPILISQFSDDSINTIRMDEKNTNLDAESDSPVSLSRQNCSRLMDSVVVNNEKVRYYYNKTLHLRIPLQTMTDSLSKLHSYTFAYPPQVPSFGDYSIISTLFEVIPVLSTMIEWESLNSSCYWDDFCRETKQLMMLLERVHVAALRCGDAAANAWIQAQDLFQGLVENDVKPSNRLDSQPPDYMNDDPSGQTIRIHWTKQGNIIDISWYDADGGLLKVSLNQTGNGFRLRFLRHIVYHSRTCLELAHLTFMKLNVALHLQIPMDKLLKCQGLSLKQLAPKEHACLSKAKREFDTNLESVCKMILRFKLQAFQLLKYKTNFKAMWKSCSYVPSVVSNFETITITVEDSLLMRMVSLTMQAQTKDESFDFTVFPDRTEDVLAKIEDFLTVDNKRYKELQLLLHIIRVIYPTAKRNLTKKELVSIAEEIKMAIDHRNQIRRYFKKSLQLFDKHSAFHKMSTLKLLTSGKAFSLNPVVFEDTSATDGETSESCSYKLTKSKVSNEDNDIANETDQQAWVHIEGGINVGVDIFKNVVTQYPGKQKVKLYEELNTNEKIILNVRLIRLLLSVVANEQCWAKVRFDRVAETKSLVKRLKVKDRLNPSLQNILLEYINHLKLFLQLTKTMRFLKYYI